MKTIVFFPTVHGKAEQSPEILNHLLQQISKRQGRTISLEEWEEGIKRKCREQKERLVQTGILSFPPSKIKIFVEHCPDFMEPQIILEQIREMTEIGFYAGEIILEMHSTGVSVFGADEWNLVQECKNLNNQAPGASLKEQKRIVQAWKKVNYRRELHIARVIDAKLQDGETAILFMGFAHTVHKHLARSPYNFKVVNLMF